MCKLGVHGERMDMTIHCVARRCAAPASMGLPGHGLGGRILGYRDWRLGMDLASGN